MTFETDVIAGLAPLRRYARAAIATGAPGAVVTLVPLDRPADACSWTLDADTVDAATMPPAVELP